MQEIICESKDINDENSKNVNDENNMLNKNYVFLIYKNIKNSSFIEKCFWYLRYTILQLFVSVLYFFISPWTALSESFQHNYQDDKDKIFKLSNKHSLINIKSHLTFLIETAWNLIYFPVISVTAVPFIYQYHIFCGFNNPKMVEHHKSKLIVKKVNDSIHFKKIFDIDKDKVLSQQNKSYEYIKNDQRSDVTYIKNAQYIIYPASPNANDKLFADDKPFIYEISRYYDKDGLYKKFRLCKSKYNEKINKRVVIDIYSSESNSDKLKFDDISEILKFKPKNFTRNLSQKAINECLRKQI